MPFVDFPTIEPKNFYFIYSRWLPFLCAFKCIYNPSYCNIIVHLCLLYFQFTLLFYEMISSYIISECFHSFSREGFFYIYCLLSYSSREFLWGRLKIFYCFQRIVPVSHIFGYAGGTLVGFFLRFFLSRSYQLISSHIFF